MYNYNKILKLISTFIKTKNKQIKSINKNSNFILEKGDIPFGSYHNSKCMISDWSGISLEYAFIFERPVIFIDVPKKVLNLNSGDISLEPIEISLRSKLGYIVSPNNLKIIPDLVKDTNKNNKFSQQIRKMRSETVFNIGESAKIGADFIQQLIKSN